MSRICFQVIISFIERMFVFTLAWSSSSRRIRQSPWSRSRPHPAPPGYPPAPGRITLMKTNVSSFLAILNIFLVLL